MTRRNSHGPNARDQELAELVILEIARQSPGDEIIGKVRLFKAFYLAHLYFACDLPGYLTEWPIVRMPKGPGIENFGLLIESLVQQGTLKVEAVKVGPYPSTRYRATSSVPPYQPLSEEATNAIREAVEFVANKSGAQLSDLTHEFSVSWNEAEDGEELSIYRDLLREEDHKRLKDAVTELTSELDEAWKE